MAPTCLYLPTSADFQYCVQHPCAWKYTLTMLKNGKLYYSATTFSPFIIEDGFNLIHSSKISHVSKNKDVYCVFSCPLVFHVWLISLRDISLSQLSYHYLLWYTKEQATKFLILHKPPIKEWSSGIALTEESFNSSDEFS